MQMIIWGFMTQFLATNSSCAQAFGVLLARAALGHAVPRPDRLALSFRGDVGAHQKSVR
jgi:hypothetical protein